MRTWLRRKLFSLVRRIIASDDGRDMLFECLRGHLGQEVVPDVLRLHGEVQPYAELPAVHSAPSGCDGTIFITGRFRSGSTLLWNIFRHVPDCTAYYEPLNERRWFDEQSRGQHTDNTHRRVEDYWREYDGRQELGALYQEDWTRRKLYMPERFWDPALRRYVQILIERATGRPVLQFNRVDFRLPWLRATFPGAKIVHLYRHPRDQWLSTLYGESFPLDGTLAQFADFDKFYLLMWARDLKHQFPFLDEKQNIHPYRLFYWIWKLSYLFGRTYADVSIAFENIVQEPQRTLENLFGAVDVRITDYRPLLDVIERPRLMRWREYAPDEWFLAQETECERVLAEFFASRGEKTPVAGQWPTPWDMKATNGDAQVQPCGVVP